MSTVKEQLEKYEKELARQEQLEHRDVTLAISSIIQTREGQKLFKYLFKTLDVAAVPQGLEGMLLHEYLGFLKAGNSIYKLVCESDFKAAALILANLERIKYEDIAHKWRIENGLNGESTDGSEE